MATLKGFSSSNEDISVPGTPARRISSAKLLKGLKKNSSRQWLLVIGLAGATIAMGTSWLSNGARNNRHDEGAPINRVVETTPKGMNDANDWRAQTGAELQVMRKSIEQGQRTQDDLLQTIGGLRKELEALRQSGITGPAAGKGSDAKSVKPATPDILLPDPPKPPASLALPAVPEPAKLPATPAASNPQVPIDVAPEPLQLAPPVAPAPARAFVPKDAVQSAKEALKYTEYEKNDKAGLLPAGSFAKATLISGVEAFTGGTAQSQPQPIVIRIDSNAILPNAAKYQIRGCHVLASVWGDMSSERVFGRLATLTCVNTQGQLVLSQEVEGVIVDSDGKNGIRGVLQDRQGAKLARSLLAGLARGMSDALGGAQSTTFMSGMGATTAITGDRMAVAGYGGVSKAADQLSQFYLKQAEATMPVIAVDAGRRISVLFTKSEPLKFDSVATYKPKMADRVVVGRTSSGSSGPSGQ
jgi:conjugal transfer pilus assembly protein TraB